MKAARTPIQRVRAARKVMVDEPHAFQAWWRDHLIFVEREIPGAWYIQVTHPDGCFIYDGYWRGSVGKTLEEAVAEAFRGAELLESA